MLSAPDAGYTSGNPASAGWGLLRGLVKQGVLVRYPGDFGWPQVSIAGRILASSAFARAIALFSEISHRCGTRHGLGQPASAEAAPKGGSQHLTARPARLPCVGVDQLDQGRHRR
jgi:hypothetical protein